MITELEYAYTFDNSSAIGQNVSRDPVLRNRYWFNYPPEWRTANVKNKVIGFRSFWIARAKRHVSFTININKPADPTIYQHFISCWFDYDDGLLKLWTELQSDLQDDKDYITVDWTELHRHKTDNVYEGKNYAAYDSENDINDSDTDNKDLSFGIRIRLWKAPLGTEFSITDMNDDAKAFFNALDYNNIQTTNYNTIDFYDIWDRRSCLLKSNLVSSTMNNYLGYSMTRYNPLRYYKITNNDEKFYIDLYNGHNHKVITSLSDDDRDHINLEITVRY
jgi:hypothetical protein